MKNIEFSIIIPVYNVEKYLNQCVNSVLNQSFTSYEIILVDDGSLDNSGKICDEISFGKDRVRVYHKKNGGLSDARNYGLRNASGEYILFLDSDDYWDNIEFLKEIHDILKTTKYDVIVFGMKKYFEENNSFYSPKREIGTGDLITELIKNNHFKASACDKIVKKNLIDENKLEFPVGLKSEDIQWTFQLLKRCKEVFFYDKNVYVYRQRSNSITKTVRAKNISDMLYMINEAIEDIGNSKRELLLSYLAYEYCVALGLLYNTSDKVSNSLKKELFKRKQLLNYRISNKVNVVYKVYKVLGIRITSRILGLYIKRKGN